MQCGSAHNNRSCSRVVCGAWSPQHGWAATADAARHREAVRGSLGRIWRLGPLALTRDPGSVGPQAGAGACTVLGDSCRTGLAALSVWVAAIILNFYILPTQGGEGQAKAGPCDPEERVLHVPIHSYSESADWHDDGAVNQT